MRGSAALCLLLLGLCTRSSCAVSVRLPSSAGLSPSAGAERALELNLDGSRPKGKREPGVVDIFVIRGQLGDSLRQLAWGILYAEGNNYTSVTLKYNSCKKHFQYFLDILPSDEKDKCRVKIAPLPEGARKVECQPGEYAKVHSYESAEPSFHCPAQPEDYRRVFLTYLKPHLNTTALVDKQRKDPDELVLHMRGGDAMTTNDPHHLAMFEMRMLPCALYDKVVEEGFEGHAAFKSVRIVTQDMTNPCAEEVQKRHPNIAMRIQSASREEDAAAMMNARYLVADQSYFPYMIALFNEELRTLWYADAPEGRMHLGGPGKSPLGAEARNVLLHVPGLEEIKADPNERVNWMVNYPKENITEALQ